jgi:hypothetical protein
MTYRIQKAYRLDPRVLYNITNSESLPNRIMQANSFTSIAGYKRILAGSFLSSTGRLLGRSRVLSPYTAGTSSLIVNNPFAFKVGDVLHIIGGATENPYAERNAVESGVAPILGTISNIDGSSKSQTTRITFASVAVGDIYTINIGGQIVSVVATSTNIADLTLALRDKFKTLPWENSVFEILSAFSSATYLEISCSEPGEIIDLNVSVTGTGSATISTTSAVGALTISIGAGNAALPQGAKIGTIVDYPVGIIDAEYYLSDEDGLDRNVDIAAYNGGMVYKNSLPYLDGQIVAALPKLSFSPTYGS